MEEIEVRAKIRDVDKLRLQLQNLSNCVYVGKTHIVDMWFCRQHCVTYNDTKMDKVGSFGLRLRFQDYQSPEVNMKIIREEGNHNVFGEVECCVTSPENFIVMLHTMGYKPFCIVDKQREMYKVGEVTVNIELLHDYQPCLEVEILAESNYDRHLQVISTLLSKLGIEQEDRLPKSITSEYMAVHAFKQQSLFSQYSVLAKYQKVCCNQ